MRNSDFSRTLVTDSSKDIWRYISRRKIFTPPWRKIDAIVKYMRIYLRWLFAYFITPILITYSLKLIYQLADHYLYFQTTNNEAHCASELFKVLVSRVFSCFVQNLNKRLLIKSTFYIFAYICKCEYAYMWEENYWNSQLINTLNLIKNY